MAYYVLAQPAAPLFMFTKLLQHIFPLEPPVSLTGCEEDSACKTLHGGPALMAYNHVQPRVAAAENMRYEESKKNPGIKAEKTILHDGEVHPLRALCGKNVAQQERLCMAPLRRRSTCRPWKGLHRLFQTLCSCCLRLV